MVTNRTLRFMVLVVLTLILIVGFGRIGQAAPKKGGTVIEAMGTEPTNLDPFKARRRPELTTLPMILEPLFVVNPNLEIEPLLVDSWKVSDDGFTWTLALKKGIKFHDETPFNAQAVKFSLERHMKGTSVGFLKAIKEIGVINEHTVAVKLHKPYPLLLNSFASFNVSMVSPTAVKGAAGEWGSKVIVGTGPFKFKQWLSGDRVILERNEDYRHGPSFVKNKGPAYVDTWVIRFIPEPATLIAELIEGNVDLSDYVTERDVRRVKNSPKTDLIMAKSTSAIYLAINCSSKNKPYDDVRVRRAMAHAINAKAVLKAAMSGIGSPLYTSIAPTVLGFHKGSETIGKVNTEYDLDKAKQLLEEAGWKDTDGDGVRDKDGQSLEVNFLAFSIARYKRMAEVATPMLQEAGFKVDLKILEAGDLYERVLKGKHDLLSTGLVASQGFAVNDLVDTLHSSSLGSIMQWCHYSNPEIDRLLDMMRFDPDPKARQMALEDVQKKAASEVTVIPIANAMEIFGYKKDLLGGVDDYVRHPWAFDQADAYRGLEIYRK
jgi:peptide/nickel transport system substrate-binding protein